MVKIYYSDNIKGMLWRLQNLPWSLFTTEMWTAIPHSQRWEFLFDEIHSSTGTKPFVSSCTEYCFLEACNELTTIHDKILEIHSFGVNPVVYSLAQLKDNTALDFIEELGNTKLRRAFSPRKEK